MPYTPIGWKDFPNEETPLSATNLNKMDMQIKENTEKLDNFNPDLPENMLICDDEAPEETETLPNVADRLTDETASYTASDIKNEFDEVKDNLTIKEPSVSCISGVSIPMRCNGNVAQLQINITDHTSIAHSTTIGTIPSGYRPILQTEQPFIYGNNSGWFRVLPSGEIKIFYSSNGSDKAIYGSVIFVKRA